MHVRAPLSRGSDLRLRGGHPPGQAEWWGYALQGSQATEPMLQCLWGAIYRLLKLGRQGL